MMIHYNNNIILIFIDSHSEDDDDSWILHQPYLLVLYLVYIYMKY